MLRELSKIIYQGLIADYICTHKTVHSHFGYDEMSLCGLKNYACMGLKQCSLNGDMTKDSWLPPLEGADQLFSSSILLEPVIRIVRNKQISK